MIHSTHLSLLVLVAAGACAPCRTRSFSGVDSVTGQAITLHPHAMPDNRTFQGTFRSPHLGTLIFKQSGDVVTGSFERTSEGCLLTGALTNIKVRGNWAEFEWDEHEHCPSSERKMKGRGFFLYDLPTKDGPAQLFGRRYLTARPFHQNDDDSYGWLNTEDRDDPWTAVEILPR